RGDEQLDVVQLREGDTGDERAEAGLLRRLAGDGEGAEGAPAEGVLERDDARAAARLARVLQRGLHRFRPRVAEERLRTAETVGEPAGELGHRVRPVEVRDVPEPLELRLGGGERRGMAVTESDDGDPGDEIEVALSIRVEEPRPFAADERHVLPRVGGKDGCGERDAHATTAVSPISARSPSRAAVTAARSFGT